MRVVERVGGIGCFSKKAAVVLSMSATVNFPSVIVDAQLFQSFPSHKCIQMLAPMAFVALAFLP